MKQCLILLLAFFFVAACSNELKEVPQDAGADAPPTTAVVVQAVATPTAQPVPKRVGAPVLLEGRDGKVSLTAAAVTDNARSTNQFNTAKGRWVLVEWVVKNDGATNIQIFTTNLKVLTVDGFEIDRGNHAGHREPQIDGYPTLGPGQMVRGFSVYDVPIGAVLKAAIYHPSGSPQFTIADLP